MNINKFKRLYITKLHKNNAIKRSISFMVLITIAHEVEIFDEKGFGRNVREVSRLFIDGPFTRLYYPSTHSVPFPV